MSNEIIEQASLADEKKETLIKMETVPIKSVLSDDKGLLLENKEDSYDSSTSKSCAENNTDIKETYNGEKDTILNGGFEKYTKIDDQNDINDVKEKKNTADNDKKENDYENKQLTEINHVEKCVENMENNIFLRMDDENNDNSKVEAKPLENTNLKEEDDQKNQHFMEIDDVEKSMELYDVPAMIDNENDVNAQIEEKSLENDNGEKTDEKIKIDKNEEESVDHNADQLKINLCDEKMDFMPKVDGQKCENNSNKKIDDNVTTIIVNQNEKNKVEEKNMENKADIIENNDGEKNKSSNKDFEKNSKVDEQNIHNNEVKNNTAENHKEMDVQDNNELLEIDNVSNIENHSKNDISVMMAAENDDSTKVLEKPLENANPKKINNGEKEKNFTDVEKNKIYENEEKLVNHDADELRINVIEDYMNPIPKGDGMNLSEGSHNLEEHVQEKIKTKIESEEKLEDPDADKREINLDEGNENLNEHIKEKRKNDIGKEELANKVADDIGTELFENDMNQISNDGSQERKHNVIMGFDEQNIYLFQNDDKLEKFLQKKRTNENEKNPANHEKEVDNDDPEEYIHKKRKII